MILATVMTTTGLAAIVLFGPRGPMAWAVSDAEGASAETKAGENPFEAVETKKESSRRVPQMGCGSMVMEREKK